MTPKQKQRVLANLLLAPIIGKIAFCTILGTISIVTYKNYESEKTQESYQEYEDQQRALEIFDAWCEAHGIVPEELTPGPHEIVVYPDNDG